ncbi:MULTISPECIES: hypothetical protein [Bacillaceae]|uniref:Uncharacterized protein n=1 Tax=Evansella alkalicola TaxID=745819 RepID=A0ABS6JTZ9_9BACI|nr:MULTISPECIES: hypothetical protein [Bacillaceae]MBU9722064.1 hypothetical protein [Bacillus alkalicola]
MELFFSPEFYKEDGQVLNVVTDKKKPVGYMAFLKKDKKMYVYGHLEEEGVAEDFKDLVSPYIQGLTKIEDEIEVYSYISVGGKKIEIQIEEEDK